MNNDLKKTTPPKDASTVVLLRDRGPGIEVYMMERSRKGPFPGVHVFPGGVMEDRDKDTALIPRIDTARGFDPKALLCEPDLDEHKARGLFVAAVRETFEESGILLGSNMGDGGRIAGYRKKMNDGAMKFADLAEKENLRIQPDQLVPIARWITPKMEKRRFDTRFFLAAPEVCPDPSPDGQEMVSGAWMAPEKALDRHEKGEIFLMPPTFMTLASLLPFSLAQEAVKGLALGDIRPVFPHAFDADGDFGIMLPHDREYPDTTHKQPEIKGTPSRLVLKNGVWEPRTTDPAGGKS